MLTIIQWMSIDEMNSVIAKQNAYNNASSVLMDARFVCDHQWIVFYENDVWVIRSGTHTLPLSKILKQRMWEADTLWPGIHVEFRFMGSYGTPFIGFSRLSPLDLVVPKERNQFEPWYPIQRKEREGKISA